MKREFEFEKDNDTVIMEIFVTAPNNPMSKKSYGSSLMSIEVRTREGYNVPHIHFKKNNGVKGCIKIHESGYFSHPGYTGTLNNTEAETLNIWMKKPYPNDDVYPPRTHWNFIKDFWNEKEPEHPILTEEQPDYTIINKTGIMR